MPRVRLITDIAPSPDLTAGIVLEQIVRSAGAEVDWNVDLIADKYLHNYRISSLLNSQLIKVYRKPNEFHLDGVRRLLFGNLMEKLSNFESKRIAKSIVKDESRNASDLIIVVMQGQTSYRLYNYLRIFGEDPATIFWDPWSWWSISKNVPEKTHREFEKLQNSISTNRTHLLPSRNFARLLNLNSRHFKVYYPYLGKFVTTKSDSKDGFSRIVMVGQHYAKDEISAFIKLLESDNWFFNGKLVNLSFFGPSSFADSNKIKNYGWIEYSRLIPTISNFEYALMPYPTSGEMSEVAEFSFPSKLVSYLTAGLNIIYLGPEKSSVVDFFHELKVRPVEKRVIQSGELNLVMQVYDLNNITQKKLIYNEYFSFKKSIRTIRDWLNENNVTLASKWQRHTYDSNSKNLLVGDFRVVNEDLLSIRLSRYLYNSTLKAMFKNKVMPALSIFTRFDPKSYSRIVFLYIVNRLKLIRIILVNLNKN